MTIGPVVVRSGSDEDQEQHVKRTATSAGRLGSTAGYFNHHPARLLTRVEWETSLG